MAVLEVSVPTTLGQKEMKEVLNLFTNYTHIEEESTQKYKFFLCYWEGLTHAEVLSRIAKMRQLPFFKQLQFKNHVGALHGLCGIDDVERQHLATNETTKLYEGKKTFIGHGDYETNLYDDKGNLVGRREYDSDGDVIFEKLHAPQKAPPLHGWVVPDLTMFFILEDSFGESYLHADFLLRIEKYAQGNDNARELAVSADYFNRVLFKAMVDFPYEVAETYD